MIFCFCSLVDVFVSVSLIGTLPVPLVCYVSGLLYPVGRIVLRWMSTGVASSLGFYCVPVQSG